MFMWRENRNCKLNIKGGNCIDSFADVKFIIRVFILPFEVVWWEMETVFCRNEIIASQSNVAELYVILVLILWTDGIQTPL